MTSTLKLTIITVFFPFFLYGQYGMSISAGSIWLDADVDALSELGSVNHVNLSMDYRFKNNFYLSGSIGYGSVKGLETQVWFHESFGGGLVESAYDDYENEIYVPYHSTNILSSNLGLSYKKYLVNDRFYVNVGFLAGFSKASTYMNLFDSNNDIYQFPRPNSFFENPRFAYTTDLFDDSFESKLDEVGIFFQYGPRLNIGLKLFKNGYIDLSYSVQLTNTDYLDGIKWRTALDATDNNDMIRQIQIGYTHKFGTL